MIRSSLLAACCSLLLVGAAALAMEPREPNSSLVAGTDLGFFFTNIGVKAGLSARTIYGQQGRNTYLLETTGTGVAAFDYDGDGWVDIFQVNGSTLQGFPKGEEPINHLYRNRRDGTFEDVTTRAGLTASGWGQAACTGDYDNDGDEDLFVTYWGQNRLFRNRGDGGFEDVTSAAKLTYPSSRWSTSCAFLDYDRDGRLDLIVANYIDLDLASTPLPSSGLCRYKGLAVACGPPGLPGGRNFLYHNNGDGTFDDVSQRAGIARTKNTYALGVATLDFDSDGWIDIYVANDSNPSSLYRNNHDGTFTDIGVTAGCALSQDGRSQSGMGIAIGDYDRNGTMDIFKTNFAGDTSTLYSNTGHGWCDDRTFASGIGVNTRWLGWGAGFIDLDNDGWLDLFLVNGHVYPDLFRLDQTVKHHWIALKLVGTKSNRSAIGSMVRVVTADGEQRQEVRGGGSYYSQSDLRLQFGLGDATSVQEVIVRWPSGVEERWRALALDQQHTLTEGAAR